MPTIGKTAVWEQVPHAPNERIAFRLLTGPELENARQVKLRKSMQLLDGVDLKAMQSAETQVDNRPPEQRYDAEAVLLASIVDWNLQDEETQAAIPVSPDTIRTLDGPTWDWAFGFAIAFNFRTRGE